MASPQCMFEDQQPAVFVGTFLQNGEAVTVCEDHLMAFVASVTADLFGVDGGELQTFLAEHAADETAESDQHDESAPTSDVDPTAGEAGPSAEQPVEAGAEVATAAEGAPTDESPPPAPADQDHDAQ